MAHMFSGGILRSAIRPCARNSRAFALTSASLSSRSRPSLRLFSSTTRTMSASKTYTFAVFAPDYTDADAFSRRLSVRPQHLENAKSLKDKGVMRLGGALISPETYQTAERKLIGSMMVYEAENLETVRRLVEEDIYYTSGVWDKEKLVILPWQSAHPLPPVTPE